MRAGGEAGPQLTGCAASAQNTPFFKSVPLSDALGRPVWVKMDALQPSGSFKLRGVGYACQRALEGGASQLVSSSGGNAGLAAAYAGEQVGLPVRPPPPNMPPRPSPITNHAPSPPPPALPRFVTPGPPTLPANS